MSRTRMPSEKDEHASIRDSIRRRSESVDLGDAEDVGYDKEVENQFEVFKKGEDVVDFRTVSWPKASIIFLKGTVAIGIYMRTTLLIIRSNLRHRCAQYSDCNVFSRSRGRRSLSHRLGYPEYLHCHCTRQLPEPPCCLSQHR